MSEIHIDVSTDAYIARIAICEAAGLIQGAMTAPSVLYKPALSQDGTMWCALLGENLAEGVAGFGETPEKAMAAFDKAWRSQLTNKAILSLEPEPTP